jgi:predicted PurR-regulated permease PerM
MLVVVTILTTFYLSVEKNGTERLLRVLLPDRYEGPVLKVFERFKTKIRRWMAAQLSLSILIGIIVGVGLWLLGVRHSFVLGVIAAIFEVVPIIGPIIVGILAFFMAISDSFLLGIYAIVFFFLVQQIENHLLLPIIMGKSMKVHPVVVIMSLLAGGKIAGLLGIILAVPIAVIVQEIFDYLAEKKDQRTYLV